MEPINILVLNEGADISKAEFIACTVRSLLIPFVS